MLTLTNRIDMRPGAVPLVIHLGQYDSDFSLVFELYSSAGNFTVESGTTAMIRGTKTDGNAYDADATIDISAKTVTVAGSEQMTAAKGRDVYELVLTKGEKVLSTANFILDVERAAMDADTIASESVLKELNAIIAGAETATEAAADAASAADRAEDAADSVSSASAQIATNASDIADLKADLTTEQTARESADTALQTAINTKADSTALAEEVQARQEADTAINAAITALSEDVEDNYAKIDGSYDSLGAGVADQLASTQRIEDSEPYLHRQSGGSADVGNREYDEIVGGSVVWNQLCDGASVTVANGRKYLSKIGSTWAVGASTESAISGLTAGSDMVFDLTALFGATIADYIYSLEQATAGAGVAFFRKLFPNDYYPYSAPKLKSVEGLTAHEMRDADDNIVGNYPLDSTLTLRGIPKLADGKLYYDGDVYAHDGTVTRKYGVVDLGTLNWATGTDAAGQFFQTMISGIKMATAANAIANIATPKYIAGSSNAVTEKTIAVSASSNRVYIRDSTYTDAASFKTAMSGVMLVYELATPTTETAEPYASPQVVYPYGTEQYVTAGIVPVGHNTEYLENLRAKLEGLPTDFSTLIAVTEKTATASRSYAVDDYLILNNTLYKVTSAIASGATIAAGTNVQATTIMAEIKALG